MSNVLKNLIKVSGNDYAFRIDDDSNPYVVREWIDTGCYAMNAIISDGDIFKGLPRGKRLAFAGPPGSGKSLLTIFLIRAFLKQNENSYVIAFESEGATIVDMCKTMGIPEDRIVVLPVHTVEDFKSQSAKIMVHIKEEKEKLKDKAPNYIMILDSIGMLGTEKEREDAQKGINKADMGLRSKLIKSAFRILTLDLSITGTPFISVTHSYDTMELFSKQVASGGNGLIYASDVIIMLTKAKEKDGKEQIGVVLSLNLNKSRYMPEGKKVKLLLLFKKGIYKYSYLLDLGIDLGAIEKSGNSYIFPDGQKGMKKAILKNGKDFFNEANLTELQLAIKSAFEFGKGSDEITEDFADEFIEEEEGEE
jgi:RecA/RadA recombinase